MVQHLRASGNVGPEPMMKRSHADDRSFGLLFGAGISGLALFAGARGQLTWSVIAGLTACATLGCALLKPSLLGRAQRAWARVASVLHYVNSRVLLTIMFGLVLWPLGTTRRLLGRDPLFRRRHEFPGWISSPVRHRDRAHFNRLY
jgi:hypothetical protein